MPNPAFTYRARPAMNTLFEIIITGEDCEDNVAAAYMALDEIDRIEKMLSRFDPSSEVFRINRRARFFSMLVSHELFAILETCHSAYQRTQGYFDITASRGVSDAKINFENVVMDALRRRVSFNHPDVQLDFGAIGKGYALDVVADLLRDYGVKNSLLSAATSSVLTFGEPAVVGIRDPWNKDKGIETVSLYNQGLSSSATFHPGQKISDIINPHERDLPIEDAGCSVIGITAAEAEIFSTALLSMGKEKAKKFYAENLRGECEVLWIEKKNRAPRLEWFSRNEQ